FGKRHRAVKRDPNCPVVIRGWLYKQDSSGLKLWKRRWFVLSDFCLFYYKDSREESVLGSIPLPSYNILFCTPRECKNRKYAFKAVHQGMRSYVFSADTQEDMLGWVRALSQSASMETESSLGRRCSSYQDFTRMGGSSESLELPQTPSLRNGPTQMSVPGNGLQSESSHLVGGKMGTPQMEQRGKQKRQSPSPRTSTPTNSGGQRKRGQSLTQEGAEQDHLPFNSPHQTPPQTMKSIGTRPLTPRCQLGSRPHTPVGRVDIRPQDDPLMSPQTIGSTPPSPNLDFSSDSFTPTLEKRHMLNRPTPMFSSPHHISTTRRAAGKPSTSDLFQERDQQQMRPPESDVDAVLTRLCGCDKLLQSLSIELAQLQADKDNVQCALEMARLQLEEWKSQGFKGQGVRGQEGLLSQKALLQEDLVTIRARMCDVSMEMEKVWSQYERMESELSVLRSHLQHICRFGRPQEQSQAQRELWMMEDILCGLKTNRNHFRVMLGSSRQIVPSPVLQKSFLHAGIPGPQIDGLQSEVPMGVESEPPPRPPLPQELQETSQGREVGQGWLDSESELEALNSALSSHHRSDRSGNNMSAPARDRKKSQTMPASLPGVTASSWSTPDTATKRVRMSEEEQRERIKRNQERMAGQKKAAMPSVTNHTQCQGSSPPREEPPFPLRVTRVLTAVLPSTLVARRVSVEDPPPELATPFSEQISPELHQPIAEKNKRLQSKHGEGFLERPDQNSNWLSTEMPEDWPHQRLTLSFQESSEMSEQKSNQDEEFPALNQHTLQEDGSPPLCNQKCVASSTGQTMDLLEGMSKSTEASSKEPEKAPRPHRRDFSVSGNGCLASDVRPREEEGGPGFAGAMLGTGRREKVGGRAPFLVSDIDLESDLSLTPEQREAKLRRVERIRERVIRSAVRESNVQPHPPQAGGYKEKFINRSFTLANEVKKSKEMAALSGGAEECCYAERVECDSCCHSDRDPDLSNGVTTEPHPSQILNANKGGGDKNGDHSDFKIVAQMPLDHSHNTDITSSHSRGVPRKHFISTNHITKLTVFPTNRSLECTQSGDASHLIHHDRHESKLVEQTGVDQNESHFTSTNRRAEWFLSTSQRVEYIPLFFNHNVKSLCSEKSTDEDHQNATCDSTWQHTVTNATSESLSSPAQDSLEEPISCVFPDVSEKIESTPIQVIANQSSSPEHLPKHIYGQVLEKVTNEIKESDKPDMNISEQTGPSAPKILQDVSASQIQHCDSTDNKDCSPPEFSMNQITPYATIHFVSPTGTTSNQNVDDNKEIILANETEDPHALNPSVYPTLSDGKNSLSSPKPTNELHIYEEIAYDAISSKVQADQSKECPLTLNELSSSNLILSRHTKVFPTDLAGQNNETETEIGNGTVNSFVINKTPSEVQTESEATSECHECGEGKGNIVRLRRDQANSNSMLKDVMEDLNSPFTKARVTVVRTSL
ncbi:uncharacterized protein si:ch211-234p6.5, partial [Megalops cyprinoides]|uniref:uncharacterized protein si:ch211-234p6.5 n=1 Tax=Megalops cyprinoides TaxID=118141 RepID=UPI001864BA51